MNTDKKMAVDFLTALSSALDAKFTYQVFAERWKSKSAEDSLKGAIVHGKFHEQMPWLNYYNSRGYAVTVTVNETNLRGRSAADIVNVRAIAIDLDGIASLPNLPVRPSILVKTPNGYHIYYKIRGLSPICYSAVCRKIASAVGGDSNATDVSRAMRIPGFYHHKVEDSPRLVELLEADGTTYSIQEILQAFSISQDILNERKSVVKGSYKESASVHSGNLSSVVEHVSEGCVVFSRIFTNCIAGVDLKHQERRFLAQVLRYLQVDEIEISTVFSKMPNFSPSRSLQQVRSINSNLAPSCRRISENFGSCNGRCSKIVKLNGGSPVAFFSKGGLRGK